VRGTHILSTVKGGSTEDTKRKKVSEGHSHPVDRRGRDKSGHQEKVKERGAFTNCQPQRERLGQVRTRKRRRRVRGTNELLTMDGRSSQDAKRKRESEEHSHSLPVDGRGQDKSGHRSNVIEQEELTDCRAQSV
jgi:hypothetical protein